MVDKKTEKENDGIEAVATVFLIYAAIAMLVTVLGFISGFAPGETTASRFKTMGIAFMIAVILAIPAIGLLLHKSWARLISIIAAIISLIALSFVIVQTLCDNDIEGAMLPSISIVIFISVIYYLTRQKVKNIPKQER